MKKFAKLTTLSVILGLASGVAMANENIAVINVDYLYSHHPDRVAAFKQLETKLKAPAEKLKVEEKALAEKKAQFTKELDGKVKALEKAMPKLRAKEIKKRQEAIAKLAQQREEELKKLYTAFQQKVMAFNAESQALEVETNKRLLTEIQKATNEVAKKDKYTLVLNDKSVVYSGDNKNITEEVLKALPKPTKAK